MQTNTINRLRGNFSVGRDGGFGFLYFNRRFADLCKQITGKHTFVSV